MSTIPQEFTPLDLCATIKHISIQGEQSMKSNAKTAFLASLPVMAGYVVLYFDGYDLMEVVMICLGKEENAVNGNRLHGMLSTLLSRKLTPKEREMHLSNEYGFETSIELEGGLKQMCNYSELIEERGIEKGVALGIEQGERLRLLSQIQKKLAKGKSLEQIADELEETVETILPLYEQGRAEMKVQ